MIYTDVNGLVWFIIKPDAALKILQSKALSINVVYSDGTSLELDDEVRFKQALNDGERFGISLGSSSYVLKRLRGL